MAILELISIDDFILELDLKQEDNGNSGVLDQLLMELRLKDGKLK